uniref:Putative K+ channel toxin n=2 Tax=Superstitionia donensis TaxID=311983 RepID=A0A1V1WBP1_9SCOR
MKKAIIFNMLLVITFMMAFDEINADGKKCLVSSECHDYCWKGNKCSRGKCINKRCKCYNCRG